MKEKSIEMNIQGSHTHSIDSNDKTYKIKSSSE